MSDIQKQIKRASTFLDLQAKQRSLMMRAMPGSVDVGVIEEMKVLLLQLHKLEEDEEDVLTPTRNVQERVADVTEWIGRGYDSLGQPADAISYYDTAVQLYGKLGDQRAVQRLADRAAEARLHSGGDVDAEFKRLLAKLEDAEEGTLDHALTLVALGEVCSRAGDDRRALEWLSKAEKLSMKDPLRFPDADAMLGALTSSLGSIQSGMATGGKTPIEMTMALRGFHQRLYFALSNAYRDIDPEKAADYGERAKAMNDDRASSSTRQALLDMIRSELS